MDAPSRIEIDLTAVSHNVKTVREATRNASICAVIKADGYGLGAVRLAKRFEIEGVEMVAVSTPALARSLAEAAIQMTILTLLPLPELARSDALYRTASRGLLHQTVHDMETYRVVAQAADKLGAVLPIHLEVDTGMSRGGCSPEEAIEVLTLARANPRIRVAGVMTHFASADCDGEFTAQQDAKFESFLERAGELIPADAVIHEANTYGLFRRPAYHRSMVRAGLALLGFASEEFVETGQFEFAGVARELKPVVRWESRVVQVKTVPAGSRVGYGSTWRAERETTLAVVPVGYADGYPLGISKSAIPPKVGVHVEGPSGEKLVAFAPVVGRVSMDQITVDITDLGGAAGRETKVELVSRDPSAPNHLPTLAKQAGTITHEVLCRLNPTLPRSYVAMEEARESVAKSVAV